MTLLNKVGLMCTIIKVAVSNIVNYMSKKLRLLNKLFNMSNILQHKEIIQVISFYVAFGMNE